MVRWCLNKGQLSYIALLLGITILYIGITVLSIWLVKPAFKITMDRIAQYQSLRGSRGVVLLCVILGSLAYLWKRYSYFVSYPFLTIWLVLIVWGIILRLKKREKIDERLQVEKESKK